MAFIRFCTLILAATLLSSPGVAKASRQALPEVLVIHSYHADSVWVQGINQGLNEAFDNHLTTYHHYMNTKRTPPSEHQHAADKAWQAFIYHKPDLVIVCDDNALGMLGQKISDQVPVVFCGINGNIREDYPWAMDGREITGVMERPVIRRTAFLVNKATGLNASKALILLGKSTTAQAFRKHDLGPEHHTLIWEGLDAEVRVPENLESFQQHVLGSKDEKFNFMLIAGHQSLLDQSGKVAPLDDVNAWISQNAPIPPFTVHLNSIGPGKLIGGVSLFGDLMGRETGTLVMQMLKTGKKANEFPIVYYDQGRIIMSEKELKRWGLSIQQSVADNVVLVD